MQLHALRFRFEPQHYLVWPLIKELELIELRRNNENAEKRLKRMDEEFVCRRVASFEWDMDPSGSTSGHRSHWRIRHQISSHYHMWIRRRSRRKVFFLKSLAKRTPVEAMAGWVSQVIHWTWQIMIVHSTHGWEKFPGLWYSKVSFHNEFFGSCTFCLFLIRIMAAISKQACPHHQFWSTLLINSLVWKAHGAALKNHTLS